MQRRQRNKIARLDRAARGIVIEGLLDGWTYEAIRAALLDAGVAAADLPSDSSFAAYRQGPEFAAARDGWLSLRQRAQERATMATALAEGGIEEAAQLVTFEALERMRELMDAGEADPAAFARLSVAVIKTAREQAMAEKDAEIARLKAELARKAEAAATDTALSPEQKRQKIREALGIA